MKRFFLVALLLTLSACTSTEPIKRPLNLPFSRVYTGSFDTVWNATVRVLDNYSITVANRESGELQTDLSEFRHNRELFENPDESDRLEEVRYRLKVKLSKAFVTQTGEPAVRVQVLKELSQFKNIYTDWERMPTDMHEENVILYRVGQRLKIAEALKRKSAGSKAPL